MIENIEIRNFQSLQKVEMEMAPFTVVVGHSSSGKSAFVRALSMLASNRRGTDFITHGESTAVITAKLPQGKVSLSRSSSAAQNKYTVIPDGSTEPEVFTKLGGDVPPEVSAFSGLAPKDNVSLAPQFDKPFLLADSPAQAAQTLGELTNVHVIFEAAKEANRQKLSTSQTLKTKKSDLESIEERLKGFEDVQKRADLLPEAWDALKRATTLKNRQALLQSALVTLKDTSVALKSAQERANIEVPSDVKLIEARDALVKFKDLLEVALNSSASAKKATAAISDGEALVESLEKEYQETLESLGTCPTCLQSVSRSE